MASTTTKLTQAPTGVAGHVMQDSSANPNDLRYALTACKQIIGEAADKSLPNQKLIILFGEMHTPPAYTILQAGIISKLHKAFNDDLLVALELGHNLSPAYCHPAAYVNANYISTLPRKACLNHLLHQNKIATCFNDTARDPLGINQDDPKTKKFIEKNFPSFLDNSIPLDSRNGIAIRNQFMAQNVLNQAQKGNHNIIFQSAGRTHVLGRYSLQKNKNCPYRESLYPTFTTLSEKKNLSPLILPIISLSGISAKDKPIIKEAKKCQGTVLFLKGISNNTEQESIERIWKASGKQQSGLPEPKTLHYFESEAQEAIGRTP